MTTVTPTPPPSITTSTTIPTSFAERLHAYAIQAHCEIEQFNQIIPTTNAQQLLEQQQQMGVNKQTNKQ